MAIYEVTKLRYKCGRQRVRTIRHPFKKKLERVGPPRWVLEKKGVIEAKNITEAVKKWNRDKPPCLKIKATNLKLVK